MSELFLGFCFGIFVAIAYLGVTNAIWKVDTVERGLAIYCPTDGLWAWNGECEK